MKYIEEIHTDHHIRQGLKLSNQALLTRALIEVSWMEE